jgi:hypothetical protein
MMAPKLHAAQSEFKRDAARARHLLESAAKRGDV